MDPQARAAELLYLKADYLPRFVARAVDVLAAAALARLVVPVGFFAGLMYLLVADGVMHGRSLGKALIGLRVIAREGQPAGLRESILRNLSFGAAFLLYAVPWIGWLLAGAIVLVEGLLVIGNNRGRRLGDELANTQVVNAARSQEESWV